MIKYLGVLDCRISEGHVTVFKGPQQQHAPPSTTWDTVTLRSSQHKLEFCCACYRTKPTKPKCSLSFPLTLIKLLKRLKFLSSQSLNRSFPNPAAKQADPASLKFLITGICFTTYGIRENLQSGARAILPKEALIENFKDFVHTTHLLRFIMPLSLSSQIVHFRFWL